MLRNARRGARAALDASRAGIAGGGGGTDGYRFTLAVPAEAGYISVARLFGAALVRHFVGDESSVEDAKLAISESFTSAVAAHARAGVDEAIVLRAEGTPGWVRFGVDDAGSPAEPGVDADGTPPLGLFAGSLSHELIRGLFPDAEIVPGHRGGTTVEFTCVLPDDDASSG